MQTGGSKRTLVLLGGRGCCEGPHQGLWASQPQSGGHTGSEPRGVFWGAWQLSSEGEAATQRSGQGTAPRLGDPRRPPALCCLRIAYLGRQAPGSRESLALATLHWQPPRERPTSLFLGRIAWVSPLRWALSRAARTGVKRHLCFINFARWKTPVLIFMRNDLISTRLRVFA